MKCDDCKFADWKRTSKGRLHPDKSGRCKWVDVHDFDLRLPIAFYWGGFYHGDTTPTPYGGYIERGADLRKNCAFKAVDPK